MHVRIKVHHVKNDTHVVSHTHAYNHSRNEYWIHGHIQAQAQPQIHIHIQIHALYTRHSGSHGILNTCRSFFEQREVDVFKKTTVIYARSNTMLSFNIFLLHLRLPYAYHHKFANGSCLLKPSVKNICSKSLSL